MSIAQDSAGRPWRMNAQCMPCSMAVYQQESKELKGNLAGRYGARGFSMPGGGNITMTTQSLTLPVVQIPGGKHGVGLTGRYCASFSSMPGCCSSGAIVSGLSTSARLGPDTRCICICAALAVPCTPPSAAASAAALTGPLWTCPCPRPCCACRLLHQLCDMMSSKFPQCALHMQHPGACRTGYQMDVCQEIAHLIWARMRPQ